MQNLGSFGAMKARAVLMTVRRRLSSQPAVLRKRGDYSHQQISRFGRLCCFLTGCVIAKKLTERRRAVLADAEVSDPSVRKRRRHVYLPLWSASSLWWDSLLSFSRLPLFDFDGLTGFRDRSFTPLPLTKGAYRLLHAGSFPVVSVVSSLVGRPAATAKEDPQTIDDRIDAVQDELLKEQVHYQQRIFKLEKENQELRRQIMLRQEGRDIKSRKLKRNPIEMYSEILDDLVELQSAFGTQVILPQVVVVGDPNSGKSSLLEMVLKTRIFPRNDYEAQLPIKITMCEGPYHLAQFNDTDREFDLENAADIDELRKELELRLKAAEKPNDSAALVSLTIWGPGLSRMVVVDLPAVPTGIGAQQSVNVPEKAREICLSLLQSPQTILLCTVDASRDSDYSRTVELTKDLDPDGRRSVYVLTKADLVETSLANPDKIQRIKDGSIFPLKAAGFYVAVPGRGCQKRLGGFVASLREEPVIVLQRPRNEPLKDIEDFEKKFFAESGLFQSGSLKPAQLSSKQLSQGVAETFWQFVKNSLRYQIDFFKARKAALEKDWKTKFYKARVLDRDELYETGRMQLLDDVARLGGIPGSTWENEFEENLWNAMANFIFDNIYVPVATGNKTDIRVSTDLKLKSWAEGLLPMRSVDVANHTLYDKFKTIAGRKKGNKEHDEIYDNFKVTIVEETFRLHHWDVRARENLRSALINTCEAPYVITPDDWNSAVRFMEQACSDRLTDVQNKIQEMLGPSSWERVFLFRSQKPEHKNRRAVMDHLEKLIMPNEGDLDHGPDLSKDEVNVVQKTLESENVKVDGHFIRETWQYLFLSRFLEQAVQKVAFCGDITESDDAAQLSHKGTDCSDVDLFYRVKRLIRTASVALRQQLSTSELGRLESEVRQILDGLERDPVRIKQYFNHARIGLAEELNRRIRKQASIAQIKSLSILRNKSVLESEKITNIQEKLEDLQKQLEEDEPNYQRTSSTEESS